jgi:hypothetical protein
MDNSTDPANESHQQRHERIGGQPATGPAEIEIHYTAELRIAGKSVRFRVTIRMIQAHAARGVSTHPAGEFVLALLPVMLTTLGRTGRDAHHARTVFLGNLLAPGRGRLAHWAAGA